MTTRGPSRVVMHLGPKPYRPTVLCFFLKQRARLSDCRVALQTMAAMARLQANAVR